MPGCSVGCLVEAVTMLCSFIYQWWLGVVKAIVPWSLQPQKSVKNDIVLVTGAGSGIGRLMSQRFAALGATVILVDVNEKGNKETAETIKSSGGTVHTYTCDLSDREAIYAVADKIRAEVGDVTILVNNAGIVTGKPFVTSPDQMIEKTMQVNTMAHFWTTKAFLPSMITNRKGHIVTIASSAGLVGVNKLADYCASKFAAVGFSESLALEMYKNNTNVKVTVVCPYAINTGMFDGFKTRFPLLLPIMSPEYVVSCIMGAVLTEQTIVLVPRGLNILMALKGFIPTRCGMMLMDFFGATSAMDDFKGRDQKKDE